MDLSPKGIEDRATQLHGVGEYLGSTFLTESARAMRDLCSSLTASGERVALLESTLEEAIADIESWAGYASEYFQDKHDLPNCLKSYRAILAKEGK